MVGHATFYRRITVRIRAWVLLSEEWGFESPTQYLLAESSLFFVGNINPAKFLADVRKRVAKTLASNVVHNNGIETASIHIVIH